ncbi:MAG: hypothetical protein KAR43_04160, partial [Deltaproteobacteria bacterium]|nr:hypothetical protein [Deltaproteobacteria bacterium]
SARYTAGIVDSSCTDKVTVTDTGNEHVREEYSKAAATLFINPSVLINAKKPEPPDYPTVGSGSSVQFEADTPFCNGPTSNTWLVESSIGSEINHVTGLYQAGREFTNCDDAVDIIKVNAVCLDDGVERVAEENVTIPACKMTISPSSITVASGGTVTFYNSLDACCSKPPEPESSWELQSAIGSTILDNPPNIRFLYRAGNNTGSQDFGETITVADSNHLNATDKAIVTIRPLPPVPVSDEDCDDQNTCTDDSCVDEQCVYECNATGPNDECCVDPACEGTTICSGCTGDDDCNNLDRDYCDGNVVKHDEGKCVENQCEAETTIVENCDDDDDGLYCTGDVICVDGSCGYSGDPCPEGKTCDEENNVCTTTIPIPIPIITASPNPMMRSRWVMLPTWVVISGEDTSFSQLTSRVSYSPSTALLPMPALVLGPEIIWQLVFVNPSWLAGFPDDPQTVTATVDGGSYDFEIQLLPFILDQK